MGHNVLMWDNNVGQEYLMWDNVGWNMYGDLRMYGDWSGEYLEDGRQVVWMDCPEYWWY